MNLAGLLDVPVIYVVENNGYSMGTSIQRGTTMGDQIVAKAGAYGITARQIDGMDVLNVYDGMKEVIDEARETSRPAFVDMRTYRFKGHSMSDPRKYRSREEEEVYESGDPIAQLRDHMMDSGKLDEDSFKAMAKEVRGEVKESIKWAEASPPPSVDEELYRDVYVETWGPYTGTTEPQIVRDAGSNKGEG